MGRRGHAATSTSCSRYGAVDPRPRPPRGRRGDAARPPPTARRYGAPTEREVVLAEAIAARVPSVEKVRLVSSGHRGHDVRVRARPRRHRPAQDREVRRQLPRPRRRAARWPPGSGVATLGLPGSAGVTAGAVGRHRRGAVQRRARARRADRYGTSWRRDRRAGRRQHGPGPARRRLPRRAARRVRPASARC